MKTIYLIRHSNKEKNYGDFENNDSFQTINEKFILSCEGEENARLLSKHPELQEIDELWASNYVRAIGTAKYIGHQNNIKLNISSSFDERHYGTWNEGIDRERFWIGQFIDKYLKNEDGESQVDVQNRLENKIQEILNGPKKRIAIVFHNACILFYLLKYCKLEKAELNKRLTISYRDNILIEDGLMNSPSIMKLEFDDGQLLDISYIEINLS